MQFRVVFVDEYDTMTSKQKYCWCYSKLIDGMHLNSPIIKQGFDKSLKSLNARLSCIANNNYGMVWSLNSIGLRQKNEGLRECGYLYNPIEGSTFVESEGCIMGTCGFRSVVFLGIEKGR